MVGPPLAAITAATRRGIESTSFLHTLGEMLSQAFHIFCISADLFLLRSILTFFLISPQRCSIGLRSGLWEGHSRTGMAFFEEIFFLQVRPCGMERNPAEKYNLDHLLQIDDILMVLDTRRELLFNFERSSVPRIGAFLPPRWHSYTPRS